MAGVSSAPAVVATMIPPASTAETAAVTTTAGLRIRLFSLCLTRRAQCTPLPRGTNGTTTRAVTTSGFGPDLTISRNITSGLRLHGPATTTGDAQTHRQTGHFTPSG
jgi:hypothetical protein